MTTLACHLTEELNIEDIAVRFLEHFERELEQFEKHGCEKLCSRCEPYLEGLADGSVAYIEDEVAEPQVLGAVKGLGPNGELLLSEGRSLDRLSSTERLRFAPH